MTVDWNASSIGIQLCDPKLPVGSFSSVSREAPVSLSRRAQGPPRWDRATYRSRDTWTTTWEKSDAATLPAGYGSVLGFNLRQIISHQADKK